jgi:peptidoglycan/LPS O-acetylase OafA/YrhL
LAAAIFFYHSTVYSGTVSWNDGWSGPTRPILYVLVPAFFALSGFLVTGSALRLRKTSTFIAFRVLRILPALAISLA